MLSNLNPAAQRFLVDLNRLQLKNSTAQQQLSSGLKVESASDAPDQIGALLQLEAQLSANTQTQTNLGRVQAEVSASDDALSSAVQLVDKITQLAGQGLSSATAQDRAGIAQQIQSFQQQLVALTATTVEGRYIFDGGDSAGAPYQFNASAPDGVTRLQNTPATRLVQDSSGSPFNYARSAQDIFDQRDSADNPTANNLFAAVNQAVIALNTNNTAATNVAIDSLHVAAAYLGTQQSFYGTVEDNLTTAVSTAQAADVSLKARISSIRDADSVEASLAVNQGNIQEQSALAAESKTQTKTLFDYLA